MKKYPRPYFLLGRKRLEMECTNPAAMPRDGPCSSPSPGLNVREAALTQYLREKEVGGRNEEESNDTVTAATPLATGGAFPPPVVTGTGIELALVTKNMRLCMLRR